MENVFSMNQKIGKIVVKFPRAMETLKNNIMFPRLFDQAKNLK